jgi:hypothetical protein
MFSGRSRGVGTPRSRPGGANGVRALALMSVAPLVPVSPRMPPVAGSLTLRSSFLRFKIFSAAGLR